MSFILRVENPGDVALDGLEILDGRGDPDRPGRRLWCTATEPLMPGGSLVITSTIPMIPLGVGRNTATMTATVIFPTTQVSRFRISIRWVSARPLSTCVRKRG